MFLRKLFLNLGFILLLVTGRSQVHHSWSRGAGSSTVDCGTSVTSDGSGNVYTTGFFTGNADFDPGPTTFSLNTAGNKDVFIQKLDASGIFLWAKKFGGIGNDMANEITTDVFGNAITVGSYVDTVDFDPGTGSYTLNALPGYNGFIQKLDPIGNFVWAKKLNASIQSIDLDNFQNIYVTGVFTGVKDFDPGPGTYTLLSNGIGISAAYILKLDNNGNFIFAKKIGETATTTCVRLDGSGNILTTGSFYGVQDFDPGASTYTLNSNGVSSFFISKLDPSGNFVWAKQINGFQIVHTILETDNYSNIYIAGHFNDYIDMDPGPAVFNFSCSFAGGEDSFVLKLDSSGNFIWARQLTDASSGYGSRYAYGITTDALRNVYVKGNLSGPADFDPGPGTFILNPPSIILCSDYVQKLDENGFFIWAGLVNTSCNSNEVNSIHVDPSFNLYISGTFYSGLDMDPGPQTYTMSNFGISDIFTSKFCQSPGPLYISGPSITCSSANSYSVPLFSGTNYTWSLPVGYLGSSNSYSINVSNISANGIIAVTASNSCGIGSSNLAITFTSSINLIVSTPSIICTGSYTTLIANGAASYSWSNGSQLNYIMVAPLSTSIYTVIGNAPGCISDTKTVTVTVNSVFPVVSVNSPTICYGSSTNLTANGATSYLWNTGSTSNIINVTPLVNTIYTVIGTYLSCSTSVTTSTKIEQYPILDVTKNTSTCPGIPVTLFVSGATSYTWIPPVTGSPISVTPSSTTIYTIIGSSPNGCLSQETATVFVKTLPIVYISPAFLNTICPGEEITLKGSGAISYSWFPNQVNTSALLTKPAFSTTYTLAVTGSNGCKSTATVSVFVDFCTNLTENISENNPGGIYPNPSSGDFIVESEINSEIEVYDFLGIRIFNSRNRTGKTTITINEKGVFFVKIRKEERNIVLKLIIQ